MFVDFVRLSLRALVVSALGATAFVAVTATEASAVGVPCQQTVGSGASVPFGPLTIIPGPDLLPINIPGVGSSPINVPTGAVVTDVDVTVDITHPYTEGLVLTVEHGDSTVLKSLAGATGADFDGTVFDDEAATSIATGAPSYAGRYQPAEPLTDYDGASAAGAWSLTVQNFSIGSGSLNSWAVTFTYATCDLDSDGVEDHSDQCLGASGHTASGCQLASRGLTTRYKAGRFKGALSSPVATCRASRAVTVWKVRRGPDRKIGKKTTGAEGRYRLRHAKHRGKYYAKSPRVVVPGVAECPAVKSATFRIS